MKGRWGMPWRAEVSGRWCDLMMVIMLGVGLTVCQVVVVLLCSVDVGSPLLEQDVDVGSIVLSLAWVFRSPPCKSSETSGGRTK